MRGGDVTHYVQEDLCYHKLLSYCDSEIPFDIHFPQLHASTFIFKGWSLYKSLIVLAVITGVTDMIHHAAVTVR